jgi:hypothetical protein
MSVDIFSCLASLIAYDIYLLYNRMDVIGVVGCEFVHLGGERQTIKRYGHW